MSRKSLTVLLLVNVTLLLLFTSFTHYDLGTFVPKSDGTNSSATMAEHTTRLSAPVKTHLPLEPTFRQPLAKPSQAPESEDPDDLNSSHGPKTGPPKIKPEPDIEPDPDDLNSSHGPETGPPKNKPEPDIAPDPSCCQRAGLDLDKRPATGGPGVFQKVGEDTHVYEAYFDPRPQNASYVRIIAVSPLNSTVYCHLWYSHTDDAVVVKAHIYVRKYYKFVPYKSVLVNCPVVKSQSNDATPPQWVVLSDVACGPPQAFLPVIDNRQRPMETNFTVCLHKALYNNYGSPEQLVEWIEVNRIFGAQKFALYYYKHNPSLIPYIEHYVKIGLLDYISWPLQHVDSKISQYKAQVSVINDCIYRYQYRTKYLALMDPDELLVPKVHDTWEQLINNSSCREAPAMLFRNQIFIRQLKRDLDYTSNKTLSSINLYSLAYTSRKNFSWPCHIRTKLIVRPEQIEDADTHVTHDTFGDCCLPPELGAMHHYRDWNDSVRYSWENDLSVFGINKKIQYHSYNENVIQDRRMYRFANQIYTQVAWVFSTVNSTVT